jgi:uncharacterized protein (TIGR02996 family)
MTKAELIAAVAAAPEDDGPRLVYADWLLERGDVLGELIRVQCRLAAGDGDPALVARERELLAAHLPAWSAPLAKLGLSGVTFARGFPRTGYIRVEDLARHGAELFARAPSLVALRVGRITPDTIGFLVETPGLAQLQELTLLGARGPHGRLMTAAGASRLAAASLPNLRSLSLTCGTVVEALEALLAGPLSVSELTLLEERWAGAEGATVLGASPAATAIRRLTMVRCNLFDRGAAALAEAPRLTSLEELDVTGNSIGLAGARALAATRLPRLARVRWAYNIVGLEGDALLQERFGSW